MTEKQWIELQDAMDKLSPKEPENNEHRQSRKGIARHDSISPLQHARCALCEDVMYLCGYSVIKCQHAFDDVAGRCWNHVHAQVELCRQKLIDLLLARVNSHPEGMKTLMDSAWKSMQEHRQNLDGLTGFLDGKIEDFKKQLAKLAKAIAMADDIDEFIDPANPKIGQRLIGPAIKKMFKDFPRK